MRDDEGALLGHHSAEGGICTRPEWLKCFVGSWSAVGSRVARFADRYPRMPVWYGCSSTHRRLAPAS